MKERDVTAGRKCQRAGREDGGGTAGALMVLQEAGCEINIIKKKKKRLRIVLTYGYGLQQEAFFKGFQVYLSRLCLFLLGFLLNESKDHVHLSLNQTPANAVIWCAGNCCFHPSDVRKSTLR